MTDRQESSKALTPCLCSTQATLLLPQLPPQLRLAAAATSWTGAGATTTTTMAMTTTTAGAAGMAAAVAVTTMVSTLQWPALSHIVLHGIIRAFSAHSK